MIMRCRARDRCLTAEAEIAESASCQLFLEIELTKLCQIFAARYLATALLPVEQTGVVINYLDPGLCITNLTSNVEPHIREMIEKERRDYFARTAEMGSRTLLGAAAQGKESHGRLVGSCEVQESTSFGAAISVERMWLSVELRKRTGSVCGEPAVT